MSAPFPSAWRPVVPAFVDELAADGIVLRTPVHDDVAILASAFADPVLGGEAGLPPLGEEQLHAVLDEQLPHWRASGQLVPYTVIDGETGELVGGATLRQLDATRHAIEIGYWLFARARGRGMATRKVGALQGLGKVPECLVHGLVMPRSVRGRVASRALRRSAAAVLRWPWSAQAADGEVAHSLN